MKKKPEIKIGTKFYWYDRDLWHIVNIFQDGDDTMVVLKTWAKYRKHWCYRVEYEELLKYFFESESYKKLN